MSKLTQAEADALVAMQKRRADEKRYDYPFPGERLTVPLVSIDDRESFLIDLRRARIALAKGTYQNRARQTVVLVRLDFGGSPHRNPDFRANGSYVFRIEFEPLESQNTVRVEISFPVFVYVGLVDLREYLSSPGLQFSRQIVVPFFERQILLKGFLEPLLVLELVRLSPNVLQLVAQKRFQGLESRRPTSFPCTGIS